MLKPHPATRSTTAHRADPADRLADSLKAWIAKQPAVPLVFALEHHYTERGLSLDLLKGADRSLAQQVVPAATQADCYVHLAQLTRHLSQSTDEGGFDEAYSRRRQPSRRTLEIGETLEDDFSATQWADLDGGKPPWGEIPLTCAAVVSSSPMEDWTPTSEEYEGYTGNAGNTLDRWYHRSALIVWHRAHHFEVLARPGVHENLPMFCSQAAKLTRTPKKRLEESRIDCIRFARALIARWPRRTLGYNPSAATENSLFEEFATALLIIGERDTIAMFLSKVAQQDSSLSLDSFILAACHEFGWTAFAPQLEELISVRSAMRGAQGLALRDVEWLCAYCCDKTLDPGKSALAQSLCAIAVERFCEPHPPGSAYGRDHTASQRSLPLLLQALLASDRDEDLSRVIRFVQESPLQFSLEACQVPCLKSVVPWSQRHFPHPLLGSWLLSVRQQLESATARRPTAPADWARPAEVECTCQSCAQLNSFLADPTHNEGRITGPEAVRQHVIGMINRYQCDVTHVLERKGRPFSLVLTKTAGSYQRAVLRFENNVKLLASLPAAKTHQ